MNISFKQATVEHIDVIFDWLAKPHMIEFWDNSQEHKDDIRCFINSKKESIYYNGIYTYWIGFIDDIPYSFFLTSEISSSQSNIPELHRKYLSIVGKTITIDFGIGNEDFLGKGLSSITLESFIGFYHNDVDQVVDTFLLIQIKRIHVLNMSIVKLDLK